MSAPTPTVSLVLREWGVAVAVANPLPVAGQTPTATNRLERREVGGTWRVIGTTGANSQSSDYTVASGRAYAYRAVALDADGAESPSLATAALLVRLVGSWLHRPSQGGAAGRAYPYLTDNRKESVEVQATAQHFVGRPRPVIEYGDTEDGSLELSVLVPFGTTHDEDVAWLFATVRAREVVLYRDNRGRFLYSAITALSVEDLRGGTKLAFTVVPVDYVEA